MDFIITAQDMFVYLAVILLLGIPTAIFFGERRARSLRPSDLIPIPSATEIISLRIYPIKSCRGIEVSSSKLLKTGLDLDRQWMFIDAKERKFQTIRNISKMTLINTAWDQSADELVVSISEEHAGQLVELRVPAHPSKKWLEANTTLRDGQIWGENVDAYEYNESLTEPFSKFLGKDIRLLLKGPTQRVLRGNGAPKHLGRTEGTKFADLAPVLVVNVRSLNELNERLTQKGEDAITTERFRPNIIVKGSDAWAEDVWKTIKITPRAIDQTKELAKPQGNVVLDVMARCARCQVPNVNPETAEKNKRQPWDTLMSYRRVDRGITFKPCFGMLCAPRAEVEIKVGDKFEVTEVTADHEYVKGM